MKCLLIIFVAVLLLVAAAGAVVWSGFYDVSARLPHRRATLWFLETLRNRSISEHSKTVRVPLPTGRTLTEVGLRHYHPMCRLCHGAPGYPREEFAEGLYPSPPDLRSDEVQDWQDAALYWIVDNGLKMTGMPAFGVTHSKEEMWGIVAFLRLLPKLKPSDYSALLKEAEMPEEKDMHHSGEEEHPSGRR